MEICSWKNMVLTKNKWMISRYPSERMNNVIPLWQQAEIVKHSLQEGKSVFTQFEELFYKQDHHALLMFYENENADYSDSSFGAKNVYLSYEVGDWAKNVCYSMMVYSNAEDVFGSSVVWNNASVVYNSYMVEWSSKVFYSSQIYGSSDVWRSTNLHWCHDCIWCSNLENQSYCIKNKQYSKSDYMQAKQQLLTHFFETGVSVIPDESTNSTATRNVTNSENIFLSSQMSESRNILFGVWWNWSRWYCDWVSVWINSDDLYATLATWTESSNLYCCIEVWTSASCYYSYYLESCSFCFGCIGLKNQSFCIFNKQYTKEERHKEVEKLFAEMEREWTLWSFFPGSMNPYYFNDTIAYLADDTFTKEEVEAAWYLRRDEEIKVDIPDWVEIIPSNQLSTFESIEEWSLVIDPSILKKVIQDEEWNYYRIVPMEYKFLKKRWLPLPREHWLQRIKKCFTIVKNVNE